MLKAQVHLALQESYFNLKEYELLNLHLGVAVSLFADSNIKELSLAFFIDGKAKTLANEYSKA